MTLAHQKLPGLAAAHALHQELLASPTYPGLLEVHADIPKLHLREAASSIGHCSIATAILPAREAQERLGVYVSGGSQEGGPVWLAGSQKELGRRWDLGEMELMWSRDSEEWVWRSGPGWAKE